MEEDGKNQSVEFGISVVDVQARRAAAEEVCWALMVAMKLGGLDAVPIEWRSQIAQPLEKWCYLCVKTGVMTEDEEWTESKQR